MILTRLALLRISVMTLFRYNPTRRELKWNPSHSHAIAYPPLPPPLTSCPAVAVHNPPPSAAMMTPPNCHQEDTSNSAQVQGTVGGRTADWDQILSRAPRRPQKKGAPSHSTWRQFSHLSRKIEYTPVEEKMRTASQGFGVFHEMWRSYATIIERGLEANTTDPTALQELCVFPISHNHINPYHSEQRRNICQ